MRNGKGETVNLLSRIIAFSLPILITLWLFLLCTIDFRLMVEFKPSVMDLTEAIKLK